MADLKEMGRTDLNRWGGHINEELNILVVNEFLQCFIKLFGVGGLSQMRVHAGFK